MSKKKQKEQKKKQRQERIRKEKHERRSMPRFPSDEVTEEFHDQFDDDEPGAAVLPSRMVAEKELRKLHAAIAAAGIEDEAQLQEFMARYNAREIAESAPESLRDRAQDLAYQAMETGSQAEALNLARRALKLDPDCVDAILIETEASAQTPEELLQGYQKAVEAGEERLGAEFFEKNRGHFWGILEARPYMRARQKVADALKEAGRTDEAIVHYEAMLDLNPNDNQGMRDLLMGAYFDTDNLEGVRRLLSAYDDDCGAIFSWSRVLERRLSNDSKSADRLQKEANQANRHVEAYLTGKKPIPELPDYYSPGDRNEAVCCASVLARTWQRHNFRQE